MNEQIDSLVCAYRDGDGVCPDALEACGSKYRAQGHLTRRQLYALGYEVSARNAHLIFENTNRECEAVTTNAASLEDDLSRVTLLTGLSGVETNAASCVLTAYNPQRYAVADPNVRAGLHSLGKLSDSEGRLTSQQYCRLLAHVRELADDVGRPTAEVGFALSAYGAD